ncbi:hypothetical protein MES5069_170097 [Mesorhizobium escarrei]|uniref:Uncharacterized protein n=1 Tax=Mesorhizobium escarrei TaxID=666018 RepID=A0ABN8JIK1_9HYPH|nr:hypothetical protein MES5069_170097 [Mesorhizobium escarrei]
MWPGPGDWRQREAFTQRLGDDWLNSVSAALLFVPSAIVPISDGPEAEPGPKVGLEIRRPM